MNEKDEAPAGVARVVEDFRLGHWTVSVGGWVLRASFDDKSLAEQVCENINRAIAQRSPSK